MPLHQAVAAATRLAQLDPVLAVGLARTLVDGTFSLLLEEDAVAAHLVADATDCLDEAMHALRQL